MRKRTMRKLPPKTREIARLVNELESACRRLKNRLSLIAAMETDAIALSKMPLELADHGERTTATQALSASEKEIEALRKGLGLEE